MNWEKANRQEMTRRRPSGRLRKNSNALRWMAMAEFVQHHDIGCFKCGATKANWAKTGISTRGPWAVCVDCLDKR